MLNQFVDELDTQMNGAPGEKGVGEYDVRYIRTIADLMGEEGIPMSLGAKATVGLGSSANYTVLSACSTEGVPCYLGWCSDGEFGYAGRPSRSNHFWYYSCDRRLCLLPNKEEVLEAAKDAFL